MDEEQKDNTIWKAMNGFPLAFAINLHWKNKQTNQKKKPSSLHFFFMVPLYDQEQFNQKLNVHNVIQTWNTVDQPLLFWGLVTNKLISGQWQVPKHGLMWKFQYVIN